MIVAAAVCPHPPLIVPELAAGAAAELTELRRECDQAVRWLAAAADAVVLVGADDGRRFRSFGPWGLDDSAADGPDHHPPAPLPLSLLVGSWLLARNAAPVPAGHAPVPAGAPATDCAAQGRDLADDPRRLGLLVLGDGSYGRGLKAPGYDDPRAAPYDEAVAHALATADADALLALDPDLSAQLGVAGRPAWQVLAGAARATGNGWSGQLHYHHAPYGVAYLVATWRPNWGGRA